MPLHCISTYTSQVTPKISHWEDKKRPLNRFGRKCAHKSAFIPFFFVLSRLLLSLVMFIVICNRNFNVRFVASRIGFSSGSFQDKILSARSIYPVRKIPHNLHTRMWCVSVHRTNWKIKPLFFSWSCHPFANIPRAKLNWMNAHSRKITMKTEWVRPRKTLTQ